MSAVAKIHEAEPEVEAVNPLERLRAPFPANQIGKLPKPTKKQTDEVKEDFKKGMRCKVCGQWHHPDVMHLDYVGHAALTDRLLDTDIEWTWAPLAYAPDGLPAFDHNGGLWIKLTVCGVTRIGYGSADGKTGGDAIKEAIGDALRNSGMRFGAALDLWHKGDLHGDGDSEATSGDAKSSLVVTAAMTAITLCETIADLKKWKANNAAMLETLPEADVAEIGAYFTKRYEGLKAPPKSYAQAKAGLNPSVDQILDDEIPY